jgi:hypothetical protein
MKIRNTTNKAHPATGFYPCANVRPDFVVQRES